MVELRNFDRTDSKQAVPGICNGGNNAPGAGHDLQPRRRRLQLVGASAAIYFCFIKYGKLQERIFRYRAPLDGKSFDAVWLLQFIDVMASVVVGGVAQVVGGSSAGLPQSLLVCSGIAQVLSKYCMNASLAAGLSFYVATLAKSAKMVPVMIGSFVFGKQSFSWRQIFQAAFIVGGTSLVTLGSGKKSASSTWLGMQFIGAALICDAIVGGVQKRLQVRCKETSIKLRSFDMMFYSNLYMSIAALVAALAKKELRRGWEYMRQNPKLTMAIARMSMFGALGQAAIFYAITVSDPVTCSAITTTRKLASVLLSLAGSEQEPLNLMEKIGVAGASAGILAEIH